MTSLRFSQQCWFIRTATEQYQAKYVINAAGAWGDVIAQLAGAETVGLVPKRRTICVAKSPETVDVSGWPLTLDIDERFYFKPDGGNILITPGDETPMAPMDVHPEEMDIALGIERFRQAVNVDVKHLVKKWAGLRTFAKDKSPVVGFDSILPNFFWLVGQGGYGIQMAPALATMAASMALKESLAESVSVPGMSAEHISPQRFQSRV